MWIDQVYTGFVKVQRINFTFKLYAINKLLYILHKLLAIMVMFGGEVIWNQFTTQIVILTLTCNTMRSWSSNTQTKALGKAWFRNVHKAEWDFSVRTHDMTVDVKRGWVSLIWSSWFPKSYIYILYFCNTSYSSAVWWPARSLLEMGCPRFLWNTATTCPYCLINLQGHEHSVNQCQAPRDREENWSPLNRDAAVSL